MSPATIFTVILVGGLCLWLAFLYPGARRAGLIEEPRLGVLNLLGDAAEPLIEEDLAAISGPFAGVLTSYREPPHCDVLFVYCRLTAAGKIEGDPNCCFRDLVRDSGARLVVAASDNSIAACTAALKPTGYGKANLIVTFERKGKAFPLFFGRLFASMAKGKSMLFTWIKLSPQIPNRGDSERPTTLMIAELGHLKFGPAPKAIT